MKDTTKCEHHNFYCKARVGRLTEAEGGPVTKYTTDIMINCSDCGQPFEFIGVPGGSSPMQPMVNFDGTELRAPIRPSLQPIEKRENKTYN